MTDVDEASKPVGPNFSLWSWVSADLLRPFIVSVVLFFLAMTGLWFWRLWTGTAIDWPVTLSALADFMTVVALLIGSWWTAHVVQLRRAHAVRGEIKHEYTLWQHEASRVLRVGISLKNYGDVAIRPGLSYTKVQLPPATLPAPQANAEWSWREHATIEHRWQRDEALVEPSETETYYHDVELPADARFVQIATVVKCQADGKDRFNWDETTLIDLHRLEKTGLVGSA